MKDSEIDTTDIPPISDWRRGVVGKFYRPIKKPLTIQLDADVLAWLKGAGSGYQTRINAILRNAMETGESSRSPGRPPTRRPGTKVRGKSIRTFDGAPHR